jgi:hypothetical protein
MQWISVKNRLADCVSTKPRPKKEFVRNNFPCESVMKTNRCTVIGMSISYIALKEGQRCSVNLQVALQERYFRFRVLKHITSKHCSPLKDIYLLSTERAACLACPVQTVWVWLFYGSNCWCWPEQPEGVETHQLGGADIDETAFRQDSESQHVVVATRRHTEATLNRKLTFRSWTASHLKRTSNSTWSWTGSQWTTIGWNWIG